MKRVLVAAAVALIAGLVGCAQVEQTPSGTLQPVDLEPLAVEGYQDVRTGLSRLGSCTTGLDPEGVLDGANGDRVEYRLVGSSTRILTGYYPLRPGEPEGFLQAARTLGPQCSTGQVLVVRDLELEEDIVAREDLHPSQVVALLAAEGDAVTTRRVHLAVDDEHLSVVTLTTVEGEPDILELVGSALERARADIDLERVL